MELILPQRRKKKENATHSVINLELFKPDDDNFPEFDYEELRQKQAKEAESSSEDERFHDKEALEMVRRLEAKYGNKKTKEGKKIQFGCPDDYMDKAAGYDLEDDFIDDSEAYDELVPSSMDTYLGGFYVNKGLLEFKCRHEELDDSDLLDSERASTSGAKKAKASAPTASSDEQLVQTEVEPTRMVGQPPTKRLSTVAITSQRKPKPKFTLGQYIANEEKESVPEYPAMELKDLVAAVENELSSIQSVIATAISASKSSFEAKVEECNKSGRQPPARVNFLFTADLHSSLKSLMPLLWQGGFSNPVNVSSPPIRSATIAADVLRTKVLPYFDNLVGLGRLCLEVCRYNPENYMILRNPKVKLALKFENIDPRSVAVVGNRGVLKKMGASSTTGNIRRVSSDDHTKLNNDVASSSNAVSEVGVDKGLPVSNVKNRRSNESDDILLIDLVAKGDFSERQKEPLNEVISTEQPIHANITSSNAGTSANEMANRKTEIASTDLASQPPRKRLAGIRAKTAITSDRKPKPKYTLGQYIENQTNKSIPVYPAIELQVASSAMESEFLSIQSVVELAVTSSHAAFKSKVEECNKSGKQAPTKVNFIFTEKLHSCLKSLMPLLWQGICATLVDMGITSLPINSATMAAGVLQTQLLPQFDNLIGLGRLCLEICRRNPEHYLILQAPKVKEALEIEKINALSATIVEKRSAQRINDADRPMEQGTSDGHALLGNESVPMAIDPRVDVCVNNALIEPKEKSDKSDDEEIFIIDEEDASNESKKAEKDILTEILPSEQPMMDNIASCNARVPHDKMAQQKTEMAPTGQVGHHLRKRSAGAVTTSQPTLRVTLGEYVANMKCDSVPVFPVIEDGVAFDALEQKLSSIQSVIALAVSTSQNAFKLKLEECSRSEKQAPTKPTFQFPESLNTALRSLMPVIWQGIASKLGAATQSPSYSAVVASQILLTRVWPNFDNVIGFGRLCLELCRRNPENYLILRAPKVQQALEAESLNLFSAILIRKRTKKAKACTSGPLSDSTRMLNLP